MNRVIVRARQATRLAEFIPWNRFLGSINVEKYGLRTRSPQSPPSLNALCYLHVSLYHCKITLYSRFNYRIAVLSWYLGTLLLLHLLGHVGAHLAGHVVALLPGNLRAKYVCFRLVCSTTRLL
jgi:hypothetical protein